MAKAQWTKADEIWCDRVKGRAVLLEERIFPADVLPEGQAPYHVRARKCSLGLECNLVGYTCQYAFNNPNLDPFA